MKNINLKLTLSIIAVCLVLLLLALGVTMSFIGYKYNWNTKVNLQYVPQEVTLNFEGRVNQHTFTSSAENGAFDKPNWQIPSEETTFSKTKQTIQIELKFINKCSSDLQIVISGIHFDQLDRFETYITNENDTRIDDSLIVKQADGTGVYVAYLLGGLDESTTIKLNYKLIETTVPITGEITDQQILSINIDYANN